MAERRMFAKSIIDSDIFVDMPTSSRLLYYDLSMRADDDGFVNSPKKIMRMTGASEDDLKMLIAKGFLIPFESGVVVIRHWKIHNYIRGDRYNPTICQEELSKLKLSQTKEYIPDDGIPMVDHMTYQRETQVRLGKDRLVKDSIDIYMSSDDDDKDPEKRKNIDYKGIKEYFNTNCTSFPAVREMTDKRKNSIRSFLKNHSEADLYQLFTMAQQSDFLTGKNNTGWRANFDWIIKPANAIKVLEGNYKNSNKPDVAPALHGVYEFLEEEGNGNTGIF